MTIVPNKFPDLPDEKNRKLAIVGEAPGQDEEVAGEPFVGASGKLLRRVLEHSGINPRSCFIGNVCQVRPPDNEIDSFPWEGEEIQEGAAALAQDLARFQPNCVLSLGRTPLRYFNPSICYQGKPRKDNPTGYVIPIGNWRGSIFRGTTGHKTVACFHPAYVQRAFGDIAYFRNDVQRAVTHAASPQFEQLARTGNVRPTLDEVLTFLAWLRATRTPASFDIEGYSDALGVTMLGIAPEPTSGIVIPFWVDGKAYWSEEDEAIVWHALAQWLSDPACPKKAHNAFYETLVLAWRHKIVVDGIVADTMMKQWEFYNELEKSLAVSVSLWTEEPYYKDDRESEGTKKLLYNFKDCACTEEVDRAIEPHLRKHPLAYEHYLFNVSLLPAFTYLHLRGVRFDGRRAAEHVKKAEEELAGLITEIDKVTLPILGHSFNVKSSDDKCWYLYDHLKLKPYARYGITSKELVLQKYFKKTHDATLQRIIRAVNLRTRISDIAKLAPSDDGRLRTAYNLVATSTGRSNSTASSIARITVSKKGIIDHEFDGTNMQNVTHSLRDVCIPDADDMLFWQADLRGADAWTVAADLAALGHPHMLNDLIAGVKPSKLLLRMLDILESHGDPSAIARLNSIDAKAECDKVIIPEGMLPDGRPADWKYISMKRVQHGTNYDGKEETISDTIFKDSDGAIDVLPSEIAKYQMLYKLRYNTSARSQWMRKHLAETGGVLQTACGIRRRFFGIRTISFIDDDIIREALASEPQANTTYCTNLALKRLWDDLTNRRKSGALFVEPLLQVHDALAGQFPARLRDYAKQKLQEWFTNPLTIHGIRVVIPVDIKVGPNWGECKQAI